MFLCSPNNPSGTVEPRATVEAILDVAPGLVIVDEAYGEFARHSALDLSDDERPLVVTRTYSKVWSLAALRLGFCVAPPWVVDELDKVVLPYHLDVSTQLAGITALRFRAEMEARVAFLVEDRERLFAALDELDGVTVFPSGANFLLFRIDAYGLRRRRATATRCGRRWCERGDPRAGLLALARRRGLPARHRRHRPRRTRPSCPR